MENYQVNVVSFVSCFDSFVGYVRKKGFIEQTPSGFPKPMDMAAINELFDADYKQFFITNKTQYKYIDVVRCFFECSISMGLLEIEMHKNKPIIQLNLEALEKYELLDDEEKYLSFLYALWFKLNFQDWGEGLFSIHFLIKLVSFISNSKKNVTIPVSKGRIEFAKNDNYYDRGKYLELFHLLGFCTWKRDATEKTKDGFNKSCITSITITNLGREITKILFEKFPLEICNKFVNIKTSVFYEDKDKFPNFDFNGKESVLTVPFISFFKNIFPNAEILLDTEKKITKKEGNFYFQVSIKGWKGVRRMIAIHSSNTMLDLHLAIQDAFDFYDNHLYLFSMDMKGYQSSEIIASPDAEGDGDKYAHEVVIESLDWKPQHKFLYIFDFGDSWKFVCKLKKIETNEEPLQKHQIVEAVGKSPKQ